MRIQNSLLPLHTWMLAAGILLSVAGCGSEGPRGGPGGTKYSCSGSACIADPYGSHSTAACDNSCGGLSAYACSGSSCVQTAGGPFSTSSCNNTCAGPPGCTVATATMTQTVTIVDNAFNPPCVTILAGHTMTWTNTGSVAHTVTSDAGSPESFNSGTLNTLNTWSHALSVTGTDTYHCAFHPSMTGTIIVQ